MSDSSASAPKPLPAIPDRIRKLLTDHVALYLRDPEAAHMWDASVVGAAGPVPTLLLTTKGRSSGEPRHVTLQYFRCDGKIVVVGSQGGVPSHPHWYLNLVAEPQCEIRIGAFRGTATARVVEGEERAALWEQVADEQPQYRVYQARAPRIIPVIVLETD